MKRVKLVIHEPSVNKIVGGGLILQLDDEASFVAVINELDRLIDKKEGFPLSEYQSLLHMIYDPVRNRFFNQVAVTAYTKSGNMVNLRDDPRQNLPDDVTVVLIPSGGCISEWETAMDYQAFTQAMKAL